jgi:hypothetical protein
VDNIRMDVGGAEWEGVDWIHLAEDRDQWWVLVNTIMNLQVPYKARNFLTSWANISFLRRAPLHGVCYVCNFPRYQLLGFAKRLRIGLVPGRNRFESQPCIRISVVFLRPST